MDEDSRHGCCGMLAPETHQDLISWREHLTTHVLRPANELRVADYLLMVLT